MANFYIKNQGDYLGKYSFTDAEVGDSPPTGWSFSNPSSTVKCSIVEAFEGHKKVLRVYDEGAGFTKATQVFSSAQNNGIIELWIRVDDVNEWIYFHMLDYDLTSLIIRIKDGVLQYYRRTTSQYVTIFTPLSNTWYRLRCDFDCDGGFSPPAPYSGSMSADTANVYIYDENNVLLDSNEDLPVPYNPNIDRFRIESYQGGQNVKYAWFDAIDYSWADGWYVGRNANKVADINITSSMTKSEIVHKERNVPTAKLGMNSENVTLESDDIILIKDKYTSIFNAKVNQYSYIYQGAQNFRGEKTYRSVPTGWTDNSGSGCDGFLIDKFNGHANVLQLVDKSGSARAQMDYATGGKTTGIVEGWICTTDITKEADFLLRDTPGNWLAGVSIRNSGFYYWDGDGVPDWEAFSGTPENCAYYRVKFVFNTTTDLYDVYLYDEAGTLIDSETGVTMPTNPASVDLITIATDNTITNYTAFFGSFDFSWASGYIEGRCANIEITLDSHTIFEGMVVKQDKEKEQQLNLLSLSDELNNLQPGDEGTPYTPGGYNPITGYEYIAVEVLARIINEKCENVTVNIHPNTFRGNLTFENDIDGEAPMGWFISDGSGCTSTVEADLLLGHKYYLKQADGSATTHCYATYYFPNQSYGSIEFHMASTDATLQGSFQISGASGASVDIMMAADKFQYQDSGGWHDVGCAAANLTLYHIKIEFECTATNDGGYGLSQYQFYIYINGTRYGPFGFYTNNSSLNSINCFTSSGATGYNVYYDAFGFSWSPFYNIGDNQHILIDNFPVGVGTMQLSLTGEKSIKKLADAIADMDVLTWVLTPDHQFLLNDGFVDSTIVLAANEVWNLKAEQKITRINKVWLKGGYNDTPERQYGNANNLESQSTYGIKLLVRLYTHITDSDELDDIAESILTMEEGIPEKLATWFSRLNLGFLQPLQSVTIPSNTIYYSRNDVYITAGDRIVLYTKYLPFQEWNDLDLVDNLIFEYDFKDAQELEYLISQK